MKSFKKITLAGFLSLYLLGGLIFTPIQSQAKLVDVDQDFYFKPQLGVPGSEFKEGEKVKVGEKGVNEKGEEVMRSDLLAKYIKAFYNWGLGIVGVISVVALMAAGLLWITSGGKGENVNMAKKLISNSLIGITLLTGSYFLLNTINPNLAKLPAIETVNIYKVTNGCCTLNGKGAMKTEKECVDSKGEFSSDKIVNSKGVCAEKICCGAKISPVLTKCFETTDSCSSYEFQNNGKCIESSKCKEDSIISCRGKENGNLCGDYMYNCYCYNEIVYLSQASAGEPCGKSKWGGGICVKEKDSCKDENNVGGRTCKDGLKCCLDSGMW